MSTKKTIKFHVDAKTGAGFHLYEDFLDDEENCPIHLELNGVQFEAGTGFDGGGGVEVTIPRAWAEKLGLLPTSDEASGVKE